jgi:hypothetical protein
MQVHNTVRFTSVKTRVLLLSILVAMSGACERSRATEASVSAGSSAPITPAADASATRVPSFAANVELPDVDLGAEQVPDNPIVISAGRDGVWLGGQKIVSVRDGDIASSDLEGGALGVVVPALRNAYLAKVASGPRYTLLALDKHMPMHVLAAILASVESTPAEQIGHLAVTSHRELRALSIVDHAHAPEQHPTVAVGPGVLSFSSSGKPPFDKLRNTTELDARLADAPRGDGKIVLEFDIAATVDACVPAIASMLAGKADARFHSVLLWWQGLDEPQPARSEENARAMGELFTGESARAPQNQPSSGSLGDQIEQHRRTGSSSR